MPFSGRSFWGTLSSGLDHRLLLGAFLTRSLLPCARSKAALMRLATGVMPARQWIKIHGKNPWNVIVTEETNSPVPPPVSSELTREQGEVPPSAAAVRGWAKAGQILDCTTFTLSSQKGITAEGLGQVLPGAPGTAPTPHWVKHMME